MIHDQLEKLEKQIGKFLDHAKTVKEQTGPMQVLVEQKKPLEQTKILQDSQKGRAKSSRQGKMKMSWRKTMEM